MHTSIRASLRSLRGRSRVLSCPPPFSAQALSLLRSAVVVVMVFALASALVSCGERDRRMGESEALDFRRNLVRKNYGALSPSQRTRIMYHPSLAKRYVRLTLEEYLSETAQRRAWEKAERAGTLRGGTQRDVSGVKNEPVGDDPAPEDSPAGAPAEGSPAGASSGD